MSDELRDRIAKVHFANSARLAATQLDLDKPIGWGEITDHDRAQLLDSAQAIIDELGLTVEERPAHQCKYPGCVAHATTDPRGLVDGEGAAVITEKRVVGKWEKQ